MARAPEVGGAPRTAPAVARRLGPWGPGAGSPLTHRRIAVFLWWFPLGCLFLAAAAAACVLALEWLDGVALQAGVGVAALFFYAALMCVHFFERAPPTGRRREDAGAA